MYFASSIAFLGFSSHPFELVLEIVLAMYSHVLQLEIRLNVWLGHVYDGGHGFLKTFHEKIHHCTKSSVELSQGEGMGVHQLLLVLMDAVAPQYLFKYYFSS